MPELERRVNRHFDDDLRLEIRATQDGRKQLAGYFGVYNTRSLDLGGFTEIIKPGFFNRTVDPGADLAALNSHVDHLIVARTTNGTLKIELNKKGAYHVADPINNGVGNDLLVSVERGDVDAMSFGFRVISDNWYMKDDVLYRELIDGETSEISYTWMPAYPATSATVRNLTGVGIHEGERFVTSLLKFEKGLEVTDEDRKILTDARAKLDQYLARNGVNLDQLPKIPESEATQDFSDVDMRLKFAEIKLAVL